MTAKQLSLQTGLSADQCSYIISEMVKKGILYCENPTARRSRLYWFTDLGMELQKKYREENGLPILKIDFSSVNWELYGWTCFSHREPVIKAMDKGPLSIAAIKRRARAQNPNLRMRASNAADIIHQFEPRGIVKKVWVRGKIRPRYELTETGRNLLTLHERVERRF